MASENRNVLLVIVVVMGGLLLGCVGVFGALGVLGMVSYQNVNAYVMEAGLVEVEITLENIKQHEEMYYLQNRRYAPVPPGPRSLEELSAEPAPWTNNPFKVIDWYPTGETRCVYWVEVPSGTPTFTAHAVCDLDGDGDRLHHTLSPDDPRPVSLSAAGVF